MNDSGQALGWVAALGVAGGMAVSMLHAEIITNAPVSPPPVSGMGHRVALPSSHPEPPVTVFRELLAMSPAGRQNFLTNRPPGIRHRILEKVREYESLDPDERELRLRATELRWYLLPLMRESRTNRAAQLAAIPEGTRDLVETRLDEWDILPPELQQEFLNNGRALRYFADVDSLAGPAEHGSQAVHGGGLSGGERQKFTAQFNQFFELSPEEKEKTLNTLSDVEREQMEKTLQAFGKLPPDQRAECVRAFTEFAGMTAAERQEFLTNAGRWSRLSSDDRQAWRDLVENVPEWPPLPPGLIPPPPPSDVPPTVTTNSP
jgi:hypothetical protein